MTLALGKSDADFFRPLLRLALPMAAQGMVTNLLNAIDVFMIGQLGETAVAAVGLSNQIFFLMTLFLFGVGSGSAIFSAQFWGKGDLPSVRRTLGLSLLLGVTGAILFSLAALLAPERLLGLYTADPAVVAAGVPYLRLVALCYVPFSITNMYGLSLRSTRVVQVPMVVSIGALTFKALIGYALIFGYFGLPALGVVGAAAATVIARLVEMAAMLIVTYRLGLPAAARPRELIGFPRSFYSRFARTTAPVILGEVLWSLGFTTYVAIYARIGTAAVAAYNITSTIEGVAFVPLISLGNAAAVILGNHMGADQTEHAGVYARRFLLASMAVAVMMGAIIFFGGRHLVGFYRISPESQAYARAVLTIVSAAMWLKAANMMIIVGILRSGGDTRFGLFADVAPVWLIGIPMALVGAFVLHLPIYLVVLMALMDEVTKFVIGVWRVASGRWINNVVRAV